MQTKPLLKRSDSEADPQFIFAALDAFAGGAVRYEGMDLYNVLARASRWHLERFLESTDLVEAGALYDAIDAHLTRMAPQADEDEDADTAPFLPAYAYTSSIKRARAIGERIQQWRAGLRRLAMEYVEIGRELMALKEELCEGWGGDRAVAGVGWQRLCGEHVGISYKTADRYIDDAECYQVLADMAPSHERIQRLLETVHSGEVRASKALEAAEAYRNAVRPEFDPQEWASLHDTLPLGTPQQRLAEMEEAALAGDELAAHNLIQAATAGISIGRAYAGWKGGEATKGKTRRDPDYNRLIVRHTIGLVRTWGRWRDLEPEAQRQAEDVMEQMFLTDDCPEAIRNMLMRVARRLQD